MLTVTTPNGYAIPVYLQYTLDEGAKWKAGITEKEKKKRNNRCANGIYSQKTRGKEKKVKIIKISGYTDLSLYNRYIPRQLHTLDYKQKLTDPDLTA